tara:strand:+ start:422 stop:616 length:195 start_codon:yes stop_codon:yes gene_type:complete
MTKNVYRGIEYTPVTSEVDSAESGQVTTYRGVQYNRKLNVLEQVRKIDRKAMRYRGAQLAMAKA